MITVCDGSPQNPALTPYSNTWTATGDQYPLEVGLAVDYNGNGVRDELEPIITQGHEPWLDYGTDGLADPMEPGYQAGVNDDPHGDDYNPQYNPTGTEGDHRYEVGETFDDFGLDGVPNTPQQPPGGYQKPGDGYDVGEGDGQLTVSRGPPALLGSRRALHRPADGRPRPGARRRADRRRALAHRRVERRRAARPLQLPRRRAAPRRRLRGARARGHLPVGLHPGARPRPLAVARRLR